MSYSSPHLPILGQAAPPRRTTTEKYGRAFVILGVAGLLVLIGLVGWFGLEVARRWDTWRDVYLLNDPRASEGDRVAAAERLAERRGDLGAEQVLELVLSRVPPDRARYVLAESLREDVMRGDASRYAEVVARSEGWPNWLRALLARPLAYGPVAISGDALAMLRAHPDPFVAAWGACAAACGSGDVTALAELEAAEREGGPAAGVAGLLREAVTNPGRSRGLLSQATARMRSDHPEARRMWGD